MSAMESKKLSGWVLVAGFALAALGLVAESRPSAQGEPDPPEDQRQFWNGYGTADSNDRMIAVTGVDITGGSLLYVIDSVSRNLSVYQATGGTKSTMKLKWVGARNIDLDLKVDGFNDESELSYKNLEEKFR